MNQAPIHSTTFISDPISDYIYLLKKVGIWKDTKGIVKRKKKWHFHSYKKFLCLDDKKHSGKNWFFTIKWINRIFLVDRSIVNQKDLEFFIFHRIIRDKLWQCFIRPHKDIHTLGTLNKRNGMSFFWIWKHVC